MDKIFGKLNYQVKPITQQLNEETNVEFDKLTDRIDFLNKHNISKYIYKFNYAR